MARPRMIYLRRRIADIQRLVYWRVAGKHRAHGVGIDSRVHEFAESFLRVQGDKESVVVESTMNPFRASYSYDYGTQAPVS